MCSLLYEDIAPKPVRYCLRCKSWLCEKCWQNWAGRAVAALVAGLVGKRDAPTS